MVGVVNDGGLVEQLSTQISDCHVLLPYWTNPLFARSPFAAAENLRWTLMVQPKAKLS